MAESTRILPTTCWECSAHCGALATVADGRVTKVAPNPKHPASLGAFCIKGIRGLPDMTYHPDRVLYPLHRSGPRGSGRWERIGWDEALDEIADRLLDVRRQYGATSLCAAVSNAHASRGVSVALLMRAYGSPNWMMNQDLCGGCRALSDRITGLAISGGEDIDNTNCALVVGRNSSAVDAPQWQALKRAKARGARIITVDPARTAVANLADLWLRPRPGTDAALALAMVRLMIVEGWYDRGFVERWCHGFEALAQRVDRYTPETAEAITGIPAKDIVAAARLYAEGPSTFVSGHGIDAYSAGVQTFRAFHVLVAIGGNLDRPGGNRRVKRPKGFTNCVEVLHKPDFRLPKEVAEQAIGADRFPLWAGPRGWQTACHNPSVIEAMLSGKPYPVRALYVSGVNIVVTYPETQKTIEALKSLDFVAVSTHTMTPTAELADIVLPKTTGLEDEEISLEGSGPCISTIRPVIDPVGEARSEFQIVRDLVHLAEKRGIDEARRYFPWESKREFNEYLLGPEAGMSMERLLETGYATFGFELGNFEAQGFKTPTGKVELYSETLAEMGLDPLPDYVPPRSDRATERERLDFPLVLLTGAREKSYHHSRFREQSWARKVTQDPWVQVHPADAEARGLAAGDWITVETPEGRGSCRLKVVITEDTPAGVVRTGMGWWYPEAQGPERGALDVNINGAMSYQGPWDPVTGSADTRYLRCRIARVQDADAKRLAG